MPQERTFTELMQESARTAFSAVNPVGGFFLQSPEISAGLFGERESVVTPGVFQTERGPDRYQDSPYAQMVRQQGIQARSLAGPDRPMTENEKLRLGLNMMKSLDQKRLYESLEPDPARRTAIALERAKSDRVLGDPNASPEDREEAELWRAWESKQIADIEKVLHEYEGKLFTDTYDYHQKAADAARKGYTPQQVANSLALSGFGKKIVTPAEWDRLEAERQLLTLNGELGKANAIALTRNAMLRSADPRSWKDANLTPVDLAIEESGRILAEDDSFQNWLKIRGANTFVASMRAIQRLAGSGEFDAQDVDALEAAVTAMGDPDLLTRSALKKVNLENLDQEDVWRSRYGNPSWHAAVGGFMGDLYGGFHDPIFNVVFMGLAKLPMSVPVHRAQAQISGRLVPGLTTRGAIARQLEAQGMSRLQAGMTARSATLEDVAVMGLSNWFRRRRVSKALSDYAGNLLFNIADASVSNAFATGLESRSYGRDWSEVLADAGSGAVEGAMMGALFHNGLVLGGTAVARSLDHLPRDVRPAIANAMEYVRLSPNRVKAGMVQNELERMVAQASVDFMREAGVDSLSSTQARRLLRTLGIDAGEWRNLKVEGSDWRPGEPPARIRAEAGMPVEPQQVVVNLRRRADELGDTDAGEAMAAAADRIEELSLESELPPQSGRDQGIHGIGDVSYHVLPDGRTVAVRYDTSGRPMTRRTYSRIYEATTKERATTAEMIAEEYGDRKAEDLLMRRKSPEEARKIGASAARDARSIEDLEEATPLLQAMQESEGDVKFRKEQLQDMHAELYSEVAAIQDLLLSEDPAVAVDAAQRLAGLGIRMNQLDEEIANRFGSDALRDTWQRSGEQVAPNFDLAQMVRKPEATGPITPTWSHLRALAIRAHRGESAWRDSAVRLDRRG